MVRQILFDWFNDRVKSPEFRACIVGGESPIHFAFGDVATDFPCVNLAGQVFAILHPPVEALAAENSQFCFGHVEPTAMLGRVVDFELRQNALGFRGSESFIEGGRFVGIEIVLTRTIFSALG